MSIYITGEVNITFVHIPKTAGTSMLKWLEENRGNSEFVKWDIHPKHSTIAQDRAKHFSFTVVRNPWDRMVSMYHYFKNIAMFEGSRFLALNNVTSDTFPTFEEWVQHVHEFQIPEPYWFNGCTAQAEWLDVPVDLVIRYENLANEFVHIQNAFRCNLPLPHIYASGRTGYKDYYNDVTKNIVGKLSERDIDIWKYQF